MNSGVKAMRVFGWLCATFLFFAFVGAFISDTKTPPIQAETQKADSVIANNSAIKKVEESKVDKSTSEIITKPDFEFVKQNWYYRNDKDNLTGKVEKTASVTSENTVNFGFPYNKDQHATIYIRQHPRYGLDVIFSIERGQFSCSLYDCKLTARFDEGNAQNIDASEPADHSTNVIFLRGEKNLIEKIKKSKKLFLGATFYQEGERIFEFNIEGLKWPIKD